MLLCVYNFISAQINCRTAVRTLNWAREKKTFTQHDIFALWLLFASSASISPDFGVLGSLSRTFARSVLRGCSHQQCRCVVTLVSVVALVSLPEIPPPWQALDNFSTQNAGHGKNSWFYECDVLLVALQEDNLFLVWVTVVGGGSSWCIEDHLGSLMQFLGAALVSSVWDTNG